MNAELLVLRLLHILGGIFWVGAMAFNAFFLMPALAGVGPAAGAVMAGLQQRRLTTIMPVVAVVTMLSGLRLMWIGSGGFAREYFAAPVGRTLSIGAGAAIVAFLIGFIIGRPLLVRAAALAPQAAADPAVGATLQQLRQRAARVNLAVVVLLIVAASAMALARYVR